MREHAKSIKAASFYSPRGFHRELLENAHLLQLLQCWQRPLLEGKESFATVLQTVLATQYMCFDLPFI
jgi:hypothetical protein